MKGSACGPKSMSKPPAGFVSAGETVRPATSSGGMSGGSGKHHPASFRGMGDTTAKPKVSAISGHASRYAGKGR